MKFIRYAFVGAFGTSAHYAVLIALVHAARAEPVAASTAGAIVGAIVNYYLNHRYTFESRRRHAHALPRFAAIALAGAVVNAALLGLLHNRLGVHYLVAQVATTLVVLCLTYVTNRAWTY